MVFYSNDVYKLVVFNFVVFFFVMAAAAAAGY